MLVGNGINLAEDPTFLNAEALLAALLFCSDEAVPRPHNTHTLTSGILGNCMFFFATDLDLPFRRQRVP